MLKISKTAGFLLPVVLLSLLVGCSNHSAETKKIEKESFYQALAIPPVLNDLNASPDKSEFELDVRKGKTKFIEGNETPTYGYNSDYLGPVIKVKRGDRVKV